MMMKPEQKGLSQTRTQMTRRQQEWTTILSFNLFGFDIEGNMLSSSQAHELSLCKDQEGKCELCMSH